METESVRTIGRYQIIETLGEGSYGVVYKARAMEGALEGVVVALKRLRSTVHDPDARKRFQMEAATLQSFRQHNIVRCLDFFEDGVGENVAVCLVLEFIDGRSLDRLIRDHQKGLPVSQILDIFSQVAGGLAYSAAQGVVHRDIKPSNIMICHDGTAKVLDYGVAIGVEGTLGVVGEYRGSLDYMSPEHVRMERFTADEPSDIFSFGISFLEALTGKHPHKAYASTEREAYVGFFKWAQRVTEEDFCPPHPAFRDDALSEFVRKCTSPERARRYQTFGEVLADLEKLKAAYVQGESGDAYRLIRPLGQGAFGSVHLAERLRDCTHVAVKRLGRIQARDRFLREVRILRGLEHPNIVTYMDHYCLRNNESGEAIEYGLVMEYLAGPTLLSRIRERPGGLPPKEVVRLFIGYAAALKYCEQHDDIVCHRDLKPANLFAAPTQVPKILDFGITKQEGDLSRGLVPGTLDYMAPEFTQHSEVEFRGDIQSDLYSLGVCLYECLTGALPFPRLSRDMKTALQQFFDRASLDGWKPSLEHAVFTRFPELGVIVAKLLSQDRVQRYADAATLKRDLTCLHEGLPPDEKLASDHEEAPPTMALAIPLGGAYQRGTMTFDPQAMASERVLTSEPASRPSELVGVLNDEPSRPAQGIPLGLKVAGLALVISLIGLLGFRSCTPANVSRSPVALSMATAASNDVARTVGTPSLAAASNSLVSPPDEVLISQAVEDVAPSNVNSASGSISIESEPSGAAVVIDGMERGKTPVTVAGIVAGQHVLRIELENYASENRAFTMESAGFTQEYAVLMPLAAAVEITSEPPGATVVVDGEPLDKLTPATLSLKPGVSHRISLRKTGFQVTDDKVVRPAPGERLELSFPLRRLTGTLRIIGIAEAATITVDKVEVGRASSATFELPNMIIGRRTVSVSKDGFRKVPEVMVDIQDGEVSTMTVAMVPAGATLTVTPVLPDGYEGEVRGEIRLNNVSVGDCQLPHTVTGLPPGPYTILVTGRRWSLSAAPVQVTLGEDQDQTIAYRLTLAHCSMDLKVRPKDAIITIDGRPARAGHILLAPDVPHVLRVEAPGYVPHVEEVNLGPNRGRWIDIQLKRR